MLNPMSLYGAVENKEAYYYNLKAAIEKINWKLQKSDKAVSAAAKTLQYRKASADAGTKQLSMNHLEKAIFKEEGDILTDSEDSAGISLKRDDSLSQLCQQSADDIEVVAYFTNVIKSATQKRIVQDLHDFAATVLLSVHKTKISKNKPDSIYKKIPVDFWGINKFGSGVDTVKNFNVVMKLKLKLKLLIHRVNVLMKTLDPTHYQDAQNLKKHYIDMHPSYASLEDPIFFWAALCIFSGTFTRGKLSMLNLELQYGILHRSGVMHQVPDSTVA
ncbi:hypothetical protein DEU56DRAFT_755528 [Suillus clintonianus]|uniref:uncharacterized protein n=1 Tax=Suillus clintonianus TaxID=1904413 RepID=UPI001B861BD3|nr:uncharacterized protein DEU56DRAFT_755528 [Suillus clintonianus]KAG2139780.1 hypothetical protein DEU56DRAFT_755528 [Suillus clintonianus]